MPLAPEAGRPLPITAPPFSEYRLDEAFDEAGSPRPPYATIVDRLRRVPMAALEARQAAADRAFLNLGITFTVYGNDAGTEKIFPYDLLPRLVTGREWATIERGLTQRLVALN